MQYSPRASWNVMLDPALHQGQVTCVSCFTTRMLVLDLFAGGSRRGRKLSCSPSITYSIVMGEVFIDLPFKGL